MNGNAGTAAQRWPHGSDMGANPTRLNQRVGWALRVKDSELRSDQHVYSKQIKPQYEENHP